MTEETFPMTPAGREKLRAELKQIKEVDRLENVREIEEALAHGDLRENAEYHSAKERQAFLASRMKYLEYRISRANVIDPEKTKSKKVAFGATIALLNLDTDETVVYSLVGEDESDASLGKISINSPIARALIGKESGDEIVVNLPKGACEFELASVEYKAIKP